ncbi:MAG TPA: hypothetical protein VII01_15550 [Solirubrobacteraceae bacterium]
MSDAPVAVDGSSAADRDGPGETDALARAVFVLLVLACFAAFFVTQRLKHTPTPIQKFELTPVFSPTPAGRIKSERMSFKLSHADAVTVSIIDVKGDVVATLVRDHPVVRYKQFSLRWNGRRGNASRYEVTRSASGRAILVPQIRGPLAPAGEYRVRIGLRDQEKTLLSPRSFTLVRQ